MISGSKGVLTMKWFSKKPIDLSLPANRNIDLNPSRKKLEWMDAVILWEETYSKMRYESGWSTQKGFGFREDSRDRFAPVHWLVKDKTVIATFNSIKGVVTERVI